MSLDDASSLPDLLNQMGDTESFQDWSPKNMTEVPDFADRIKESAADRPWSVDDVAGLPDLIDRMDGADSIRDWSFILADHLSFGNKKLADNIAIFNIGSASDCVNLATEHCQVDEDECYACNSEELYPNVLDYRRRQEYIWDALDPDTFAQAFLEVISRKRSPVKFLRFNESGDLRHQSDVIRMNRVAEILSQHDITVYTYTASDFLDLGGERHFVVNASNPWVENADQKFVVVEDEDDIPEDGFLCRYSVDETQCGDCLACMNGGGSGDVYELLRD